MNKNEIINGYKIIDKYPNISKEENEERSKMAFIHLRNLFVNRLTQK